MAVTRATRQSATPDPVAREVEFSTQLRGVPLNFSTTWGLFSPKTIDAGTRLLLDTMAVSPGDTCLDLGCGYGAIGIALAKSEQTATVYMVDKDFVAVEYACKNVARNRLTNCHVQLSNGFSELSDLRFDRIAANLPANVGKELLHIFLTDAQQHLNRNGHLYVVTIAGLRTFIKRNFLSIFGNYEKVKQRQTHTVALATRLL